MSTDAELAAYMAALENDLREAREAERKVVWDLPMFMSISNLRAKLRAIREMRR